MNEKGTAKTSVSCTIDTQLLARIDKYASATDRSRSSVLQDVLYRGASKDDSLDKQLDNPLLQLLATTLSNPSVLRALTAVIGEAMSEEEIQKITEGVRSRIDKSDPNAKKLRTNRFGRLVAG